MEKLQKVTHQLKKILLHIFINRLVFPPYFFLLAICFKILYPQFMNLQSTLALMAFCLPLTIITGQSYYYLLGPMLNNQFLSITGLNLLVGLITANQKWKVYLYILSILQYISSQYNNEVLYITVIACGFITLEVYKHLIFQKQHNQICFMFLLMFTMILIVWLGLKAVNLQQFKNYLVIGCIIFFSKPFQQIYKNRIRNLATSKTTQIKCPYQAYAYIQQYKRRLQITRYRFSLVSHHKFNCCNPECECRKTEHNEMSEKLDCYLIELLYKDFLEKPKNLNFQFLYHKFINLKIKQGKLLQAISMCQSVKSKQVNSIFLLVHRLRSEQTLKKRLLELDEVLCRTNLYLQGLQYDRFLSYLAKKIQQILWMKIQFLRQVGKQSSKLSIIEEKGHQIIDQFGKLHDFFQRKILKLQEKLNCCTATIIYCFYLISITNSTEYPRLLIKNTKNNFQQSQSNNIQKYEIQTIFIESVENKQNSHSLCCQQQEIQPQIKNAMVIKGVSESFCKLSQVNKSKLIGTQIQNLIPPVYRKDHDKLVYNVFHGVYDSDSKLLSNRRLYPVYFGSNQTALITINLKILIQNNSKIGFIALLQPIPRKHKLILTNFNFENLSAEPFCDYRILESYQLRKEIWKNKKKWMEESFFKTSQILVDFQEQRFSVKISSPSQHRFLKTKQQLPIHLEIKNELQNDPTQAENYIKIINDFEIRKYLDNIEENLMPVVYSQETNGTKKLSLNYLRRISKLNSFSFFKFIYAALFCLIVISIVSSTIHCHVLRSNALSNDQNSSLLGSLEIFQNIKLSFSDVLSMSFDLYAKTLDRLQEWHIAKSYGNVNFTDFAQKLLSKKYEKLNLLISENLPKLSGQIQKIRQQMFYDKFQIPYNVQLVNQTFYGVLKNCLVDIKILSHTICQRFNDTTIRKHYLTFIKPQLDVYIKEISQQVDNNFYFNIYGNIIMSISFGIFLLILLIPLKIFFNKYSKHRIQLYDILLSVDGKYIKSQIEVLLRLHNFVEEKRNYGKVQINSHQNFFKKENSRYIVSDKSFIDNQVIISNQLRSQTQKICIRKKDGQLKLEKSSQQNGWKPTLDKCLMIIIILMLIFTFFIVGGVKIFICFKFKALKQMQQIDQNFDYDRQQSLLNLKDLASKASLQNAPLQEVQKQYQISKQKIEQLQNFVSIYQLDETSIPCQEGFQSLIICSKQYSEASLTYLLLGTQKLILHTFQTNQILNNIPILIQFGSTILIRFEQIIQYKAKKRAEKQQQFLKFENKLMVICQVILYLECVALIIASCYVCIILIRIYLKQIQFFLLLSMESIQNNKRMQCFMEKISKY